MKLAVFGASVSHQTINHITGEVTGYVEVLRREYSARLGVSEIRQITYPGNRLSDGGLVRLANVVAWRPDICLIEPLIEDTRRGTNSLEIEKRYVYVTLLESGILPVTVLLPEPLNRPACELPHYDQFIGISRQYGLPVIEVSVVGLSGLEMKFKGVHTKLEGAQIYAQQIAEALRYLSNPCCLVARALERIPKHVRPKLTIAPLHLPLNSPKQIKKIEVSLTSNHPEPVFIRLVQQQNIGIFSPVLDLVMIHEGYGQIWSDTLSIWDTYCHYSRLSYVMLANTILEKRGNYNLLIKISKIRPDYSLCYNSVVDWPVEYHLEPTGALFLISNKTVSAGVALIK